jgi:hypothetical protein
LGIQAGSIATSSTYQIDDIIGGINLFGNTKYSLQGKSSANNALCRVSTTKSEVTPADKVVKYATAACEVTFEGNVYTDTRGLDLDGNDNRNWKVKSIFPHLSTNPNAPYAACLQLNRRETFARLGERGLLR